MIYIQSFFTIILTLAFFMTLFWIGAYIIIPALLICFLLGCLIWFGTAIRLYIQNKLHPVQHLKPAQPRKKSRSQVIDVDYTEL